jgi:hypothetical protein
LTSISSKTDLGVAPKKPTTQAAIKGKPQEEKEREERERDTFMATKEVYSMDKTGMKSSCPTHSLR